MRYENEDAPPNEAFEPVRERVTIEVGAFVQRHETVYRIEQVLDFESAIGVSVETGRSCPLRIGELSPVGNRDHNSRSYNVDLADIADKDWQIAEQRFSAIKPFVNRLRIGREDIEFRAKELSVNPATLYRWLKRYRAYGVVTALIPQKRGWKEGNARIPSDAAEVIEKVIRDFYLTLQRSTAQKAVIEVQRICQERGIKAPSPSAIRARITKITEKEKLRGGGTRNRLKTSFCQQQAPFLTLISHWLWCK